MSDLDPSVLIERLKTSVSDPAKKEIVAELAVQATRVASIYLTDPVAGEREMLFIRAATANLAAAEAATVHNAILDWLSRLLRAAIIG